jgi:hypothetical protein
MHAQGDTSNFTHNSTLEILAIHSLSKFHRLYHVIGMLTLVTRFSLSPLTLSAYSLDTYLILGWN